MNIFDKNTYMELLCDLKEALRLQGVESEILAKDSTDEVLLTAILGCANQRESKLYDAREMFNNLVLDVLDTAEDCYLLKSIALEEVFLLNSYSIYKIALYLKVDTLVPLIETMLDTATASWKDKLSASTNLFTDSTPKVKIPPQ